MKTFLKALKFLEVIKSNKISFREASKKTYKFLESNISHVRTEKAFSLICDLLRLATVIKIFG